MHDDMQSVKAEDEKEASGSFISTMTLSTAVMYKFGEKR